MKLIQNIAIPAAVAVFSTLSFAQERPNPPQPRPFQPKQRVERQGEQQQQLAPERKAELRRQFEQMPPEKKREMKQRFEKFNKLTPEQQRQLRQKHNQVGKHLEERAAQRGQKLTPEERMRMHRETMGRLKNHVNELGISPKERENLRTMPEAQRRQFMGDRMRQGMKERQANILRNLSQNPGKIRATPEQIRRWGEMSPDEFFREYQQFLRSHGGAVPPPQQKRPMPPQRPNRGEEGKQRPPRNSTGSRG